MLITDSQRTQSVNSFGGNFQTTEHHMESTRWFQFHTVCEFLNQTTQYLSTANWDVLNSKPNFFHLEGNKPTILKENERVSATFQKSENVF